MIRLGLPKGRLGPDSARFCLALGVATRPGVHRYQSSIGGLQVSVHFVKAPDVARLLQRNLLDLGLTGDEWLAECGVPADLRCFEVGSYHASVCLMTAADGPGRLGEIRSVVTPFPNMARTLLPGVAPHAGIVDVRGSSEALVPGAGDACLDLVETGTSAALHSLAVRKVFEQVTTHLVRSPASDPDVVAPAVTRLAEAKALVP